MTKAQLDGAMESFERSVNVITENVQELVSQAYKKGYEDGLKIREVRADKNSIMIGDEVFFADKKGHVDGRSFIVTEMGRFCIGGVSTDGKTYHCEGAELDYWNKTGRHVPILEMLSVVKDMLKEGT